MAAGLCCRCSERRVTAVHCERHRLENNMRQAATRVTKRTRHKKYVCGQCGKSGHNAATCATRKAYL